MIVPFHVSAAEAIQPLPTPKKEEIKQKWIELDQNRFSLENPFLEQPSVQLPYRAGVLHKEYIKQGVNTANFYRYMSGLPMNLIDTDELNAISQYGAVVTAKNGFLSHYPQRPADMPEDFYEKGYESASTSNLAQMLQGSETRNFLSYSVDMYMDDSDPSNISRVGHRMWVLSPNISEIGFGLAPGGKYWFSPLNVISSFDWEPKFSYNYFAYPSTGSYPKEYFEVDAAWSISLNPDLFNVNEANDLTVKLVRESDGKTWDFTYGQDTNEGGEKYFNYSTGYGGVNSIIFRPDNLDYIQNGEKFTITVKGLVDEYGNELPIHYTTDFFDLIPDRAYGKIIDADTSKPISNAKVHFYKVSSKGKSFYKTLISDTNGEYDYSGFPLGKYVLKVEHPDYNFLWNTELVLENNRDRYDAYNGEIFVYSKPVITPNVNKVTDQSVAISGKAEANRQIVIRIGKNTWTTRTNSKGIFSVSIPKQKAGTIIKIFAASENGKVSEDVIVRVVDVTPPAPPKAATITTKSKIITGTAEPNASIKIYLSNKYIAKVKASKDGKFSYQIKPQKANTIVKLIAYDAAGNHSKPIVTRVKK